MKIKFIASIFSFSFCAVVYAGQGEDIANKLSTRYNNSVEKCGNDDKAAYWCSGIVIHGAGDSDIRFPWAPPTDNSMSYSYLRKDVFNRIYSAYDYGIILFPQSEISSSHYRPSYSCAFPINGTSNGRDDDGCGAIPNDAASASCQSQGINNSGDWIEQYATKPGLISCGWDLRKENQAQAFKGMIDVSTILINKGFSSNNEIVLASWGEEPVEKLPIEAIFYSQKFGESKLKTLRNILKAQEAQLEYYSLVKKWIPVIHLNETRFDNNKYRYSFSYNENEQAIPAEGMKQR